MINLKNCFLTTFTSGRNSNLPYYLRHIVSYILPQGIFPYMAKRIVAGCEQRADYDYIMDRVNYYNKLSVSYKLPDSTICIGDFKLRQKDKHGVKINSKYFFDTYEIIKYFDRTKRVVYLWGDITIVPEVPSIVKSRPIGGNNSNSILLKLDRLRHFIFLRDSIQFREKKNKAICLSKVRGKPHRIEFLRQYYGSDICDCGDVNVPSQTPEWSHPKISIWAHLEYKFILTLEGNDVATNLKWVMSSNSLAVMPIPKYETWFMEGRLIANYHYVEIKSDYSDLEDRMNYYIAHPDEAEKIIKNANEYTKQFTDKKREQIISHLVAEKYIKLVN